MPASDTARAWRCTAAGVIVTLRLTPKSSRDAIEGVGLHGEQPVVKARVRAVPEKGKANAALQKLVARWLGVPPARVALVGGAGARVKAIEIAGDPQVLEDALRARLDGGGATHSAKETSR